MTRRLSLVLFGLAVIASGCTRYFGAEGGEKGLWFGIVTGLLALIAGWRGGTIGLLLGVLSVAFVGGWFFYEALILGGYAQAEVRQLIVLGLAVVEAGVLVGTMGGSGSVADRARLADSAN